LKERFAGYYRPTDEEFNKIWSSCYFVLDTNILLDLYEYTPKTREDFIEVLNKLSDMLWVPYQVALEYQRRRLDTISNHEEVYEDIKRIRSRFKKSSGLTKDEFIIKIDKMLEDIETQLAVEFSDYPKISGEDKIRDEITSLLNGKVGECYDNIKLKEIYKEGETRYEERTPPGYKDGKGHYGDLVIWLQIIDKSKHDQKPIILVTDDRKEDWWWIHKGQTIDPRPELIQEFKSKTENQQFYMYKPDKFLEHARDFLRLEIEQDIIEEVGAVSLASRKTEQYAQIANIMKGVEINKLYIDQTIDTINKINNNYINAINSIAPAIIAANRAGERLAEMKKFAELTRNITNNNMRIIQSATRAKSMSFDEYESSSEENENELNDEL